LREGTTHKLICPSCREGLACSVFEHSGGEIFKALLCCASCNVSVPVLEGFALFEEALISNEACTREWLDCLHQEKFGSGEDYKRFLHEKQSRKTTDYYAAFQPFNESSRVFYTFLPLMREVLEPGDIILDIWCRTGWTGELLAGLFPEQQVISLWEGDSNVLGYKGFAHWLGSESRAKNLEIVFTHADQPLPFVTGSVKLVYGLDSIHRYRQNTFIPECLRVCNIEGMLLFPHIHLSNNEPEPYFDRGCNQYHGAEWKVWVDTLLEGSSRSGWLFPEAGIFEAEQTIQVVDDSNTEHYNGLLLIGKKDWQDRTLEAEKYLPNSDQNRFVFNPLLNINLDTGLVKLEHEHFGDAAATMLTRHPCYAKYLDSLSQGLISNDEAKFLWHARKGLNLKEIACLLEKSNTETANLAEKLCLRELLHASPISAAMANLQAFYSFVELPQNPADNFTQLWRTTVSEYGFRPMLQWLEDGSELSADDISSLVNATRLAFGKNGIEHGQKIALVSGHHPAALIVCWAAWLEGISVALIDSTLSVTVVKTRCEHIGAKWLFSDRADLSEPYKGRFSLFEQPDEIDDQNSFICLIEQHIGATVPDSVVTADNEAVILFSSGSTGEPKSIVLNHRAICLSGHNMANVYSWKNERLLSLGPFSMMSGLRIPLVSSLISRSTILLPGCNTVSVPLCSWEYASASQATVIATVPAWLESLVPVGDKLRRIGSLRQVLVTGTPLSASSRIRAMELLKAPVHTYYGLTETGGICLASTDEGSEPDGCLGLPVGAIVRILDKKGELLSTNREGVLHVYSDQLMTGYLDETSDSVDSLQDGWIVTGDIGLRDEYGRVILAGRVDDLLNLHNGLRLHPEALESSLMAIVGVHGAAVTQLLPRRTLVALVVSDVNSESLMHSLKKVSDVLPEKILRVKELPINSNGKLRRSELPRLALQTEEMLFSLIT